MMWEYLVLAAILAWALFYLWRTLFRKKGCSCGTCPASKKEGCAPQGLGDLRQCPESEGKDGGKVYPVEPGSPPGCSTGVGR